MAAFSACAARFSAACSSSDSLSAAALLLAVYGGYYLATLLSCRRMALSAAHRQREE